MSYKILFLEDNPQDVELMKRELDKTGLKNSYLHVSNKQDFLSALTEFIPDIVLADYSMPMFNGMHAFKLFKDMGLNVPFILVTGSLTENLAMECQSEGVDDFMLKASFKRLPEVLLRNLKLKKVELEKQKISAELELKNAELKMLYEKAEIARAQELLSNREFEILCLIASAKTVKEIADKLCISPATVATYRARLMEKLAMKSNVELTQYAIRNKLI
ncbi:MAG: response regulator transcription factor [Bacteroidota bacterium]